MTPLPNGKFVRARNGSPFSSSIRIADFMGEPIDESMKVDVRSENRYREKS
jgi:hypothetical protein